MGILAIVAFAIVILVTVFNFARSWSTWRVHLLYLCCCVPAWAIAMANTFEVRHDGIA